MSDRNALLERTTGKSHAEEYAAERTSAEPAAASATCAAATPTLQTSALHRSRSGGPRQAQLSGAVAPIERLASALDAGLQAVFSLDLRSLACLRVSVGLLLLADLLMRSRDLVAFYTNDGVVPRAAILANARLSGQLSLHLLSGSWEAQAFLFFLAGGFALMLLLGYRARLAIVASFCLLVSLDNRNPVVLSGADALFRLVVFWMIFLPIGARWSIDGRLNRRAPTGVTTVYHLGTIAYVLQMVAVYTLAGLAKSGTDWRVDGTAVYYALSLGQFSSPLGQWLLPHYDLLRVLTFAVVWLEMLGPLLFLAPIWAPRLRMLGIGAFVLLQAGFGLTLANLGLFPFVGSLMLVALVPPAFWDGCATRLSRIMHRQPHVVSAACDKPAQLAGPVADPSLRLGVLPSIAVAFLLMYLLATSIARSPYPFLGVPQRVAFVGSIIGLNVGWGMFAPNVNKNSGWFVMPGTLQDGRQVDLNRGGNDLSWEKPASVAETYPDQYWQSYLQNLYAQRFAWAKAYYGPYLCRSWNAAHSGDERLESLDVNFVLERSLPDYATPTPQVQRVLQQSCAE